MSKPKLPTMDALFEKAMEEVQKTQTRINKQFEAFFGKDKFPIMDFENAFKSVFERMDQVHARQLEHMQTFHKEFEKRFNEMLELQQEMLSSFMPKPSGKAKPAAPAAAKPAAKTSTATAKTGTTAAKTSTATAKKPAARKPAATKKPATANTAATPKPPAATKTPAKKAPAAKSATKPAARKPAPKKPAPKKPAAKKPAAKKPAAPKSAEAAAPQATSDTPAQPDTPASGQN